MRTGALAVVAIAIIATGAFLYLNTNIFGQPPEQCQTGYHLVNGQCVPTGPTSCEFGYRLENGFCVPNTIPPVTSCETGWTLVNGECIPNVSTGGQGYIITANAGTYTVKNAGTSQVINSGTNAVSMIQAALDGLSHGRTTKERVLLQGDFVANGEIQVKTYTIFEIQGTLKLGDARTANLLYLNGALIDVKGGILDCNKTNQVDGNLFASQHCIYGINLSDTKVSGVEIKNAVNSGIFIRDGKRNVIENNNIHHNGDKGIFLDNTQGGLIWAMNSFDQKVTGNNIHDNGDVGITLSAGGVTVSGNTIANNPTQDISISTNENNANIVISGNTISSSTFGISAYRSPTITIDGNQFSSIQDAGIKIANMNYATVKNNQMSFIGKSGILFQGSANSIVEHNTITGYGATAGSTVAAGIMITTPPGVATPSYSIRLLTNEAMNGNGYGIRIEGGSHTNDLINNNAHNNSLGQISITNPTQQGTISGNIGYP